MRLITLFYNRNTLVANQHAVFTLGKCKDCVRIKDKGCSVFGHQWNWLPLASDFLFVAILCQLVHSYRCCRAAPVCLVLAINGWGKILHWHERQFKNCKGPDLAQCEMNKDLYWTLSHAKLNSVWYDHYFWYITFCWTETEILLEQVQ